MTTATHDRITREEALSEQETVRRGLARFANHLTDNGNEIARFFYDVFQGEYPDAKFHHRQQAAVNLAVMTGNLPENTPGSVVRVARVSDHESKPKPKKRKITMKEIANWDMGRLTRIATDDCRKLIQALYDIMHDSYVFPSANPAERKYQKATRIRPHHQMAAAFEILKRGHGSRNPDCGLKTSYLEEKMLHTRLSQEFRDAFNNGLEVITFLLHVIDNPAHDRWGNIITDPYTQTHRIIAIKHLIWRGADIPWEHITPEMIDEYLSDLDEKHRLETERRAAERKAAAHAPLTPEQDANVRAMFDEMQCAIDESDAKAAAKAEKKAQKAAKKADAAKKAELDAASAGMDAADSANSKNAVNGKCANPDSAANSTGDTDADAPPSASATPPTDRGARAVANAIDRHPEVDLDTALENHHATAGVPKQNLTYAQIYDAIIAEANFQKRQRKFKNIPPTDGPEDSDPPNVRSP